MLDLTGVFEDHALTMAWLSVIDSADHAIVRVLTSRSDLARQLLQLHGLAFSEVEVLAVELGRGKTLTGLCRNLFAAELNIHYAYPLLVRPRGLPVIALCTDDILLSGEILRRKMFTLLAENDLVDNAARDIPD